MLASVTDAKSVSFETIGGVQTVKITGKVAADAVNKADPQIKAGGELPATVWIEKDAPSAGPGPGRPERGQQRDADAVRLG